MNTKLFTSLFIASAAVSGVISHTSSASAAALSVTDSVWTDTPATIRSKSQTKFNAAQYQKFVQRERVAIPNSGQFQLDSNRLKLKYDYNVSAFFINEGAAFRNQLAFTSTGTTNTKGLLFNDISSSESIMKEANGALKLGDSVQLGKIEGGSQVDFFLRANGWTYQQQADALKPSLAQAEKKAADLRAKATPLQEQAQTLQQKVEPLQKQTQALQLQAQTLQLQAQTLQLQADKLKANKAPKTEQNAANTAAQNARNAANAANTSARNAQNAVNAASTIAQNAQKTADKALQEVQNAAKEAQTIAKRIDDTLNNANVFGTQTAYNADALQHVVAYMVDQKYLLLGFEDLYGEKGVTGGRNQKSDRDFNDTVFMVDIGKKNARSLLKPVPEPSVALSLLGLGAAGLVLRRRQNSAIK
ncbi:DUF4114 domain-containing protein [Phormidesmis priestleyi]